MAKAVAKRFDVQIQTPNYGGLYAGGKFVRLATAADLNGAYTYSSGTKKITGPAATALANIDGVAPAVGDRVLVKNAATGSNNGVFVVNALGGAGAYELERDFDFDASADALGAWGLVTEGTNNGGGIFRCTNTGTVTLDTTALTFSITVPSGSITAGAGLTGTTTFDVVSGNGGIVVNANDITLTLDTNSGLSIGAGGLSIASTVAGAGLTWTNGVAAVATADTSITVNADSIQVALAASSGLEIVSGLKIDLDANSGLSLGAGGLSIASTVAGAGLTWTNGVAAVATADTSITVNADSIQVALAASSGLEIVSGLKIDLDAGSGLSLGAGGLSIGAGGVTQTMLQQTAASGSVVYSALNGTSGATWTLTHSMGKQFPIAQVYDVDTNELVDCSVTATSTTQMTFAFGADPGNNKRRAVLLAVA